MGDWRHKSIPQIVNSKDKDFELAKNFILEGLSMRLTNFEIKDDDTV